MILLRDLGRLIFAATIRGMSDSIYNAYIYIYIYKQAEPCVSVCLGCEVNPRNPWGVFALGTVADQPKV